LNFGEVNFPLDVPIRLRPHNDEALMARQAIMEGLDTLFRRLGPPPDHLRVEQKKPMTSGGGARE
jgi:hypothetical protein